MILCAVSHCIVNGEHRAAPRISDSWGVLMSTVNLERDGPHPNRYLTYFLPRAHTRHSRGEQAVPIFY